MVMPVHRPVIHDALAEEIHRRRGMVPFQVYVNELLRESLKAKRTRRENLMPDESPDPLPTMPDPVKRTALSQTWRR
jgi:hypothetical protein